MAITNAQARDKYLGPVLDVYKAALIWRELTNRRFEGDAANAYEVSLNTTTASFTRNRDGPCHHAQPGAARHGDLGHGPADDDHAVRRSARRLRDRSRRAGGSAGPAARAAAGTGVPDGPQGGRPDSHHRDRRHPRRERRCGHRGLPARRHPVRHRRQRRAARHGRQGDHAPERRQGDAAHGACLPAEQLLAARRPAVRRAHPVRDDAACAVDRYRQLHGHRQAVQQPGRRRSSAAMVSSRQASWARSPACRSSSPTGCPR